MSEVEDTKTILPQEDAVAVATIEKEKEESDIDESSDEEIILDEASDTEDFKPPQQEDNDESSDESCSSGEEEEGVHVQANEFGGVRFAKLVFDDIEAKKKQRQESDDEDTENEEHKIDENTASDDAEKGNEKAKVGIGSPFKKYRTASILDEDMEENYKSDEDDNFDPIYCGETLSDIEYAEGDDRDTESEPETEEIGSKHKRTGEALISIKMSEELKIPPNDEACGLDDSDAFVKLDSSMECS